MTTTLPRPATAGPADQPVDPRAERGYAGYDWASSGYVTVVTTAVGGPFLDGLAQAGGPVHAGALTVAPSVVLPATLVLSVLAQVVVLPLLGRRVDAGADPALLVRRCAVLGGLFAGLLALAPTWPVAALASAAATVCFGAAMVPYSSMLPRLAPGAAADRLSARAFAVGYLGGGLLLAAALGLLTAGPFGQATGVRVAIAAAGLWWAGFAWTATRSLVGRVPAVPASSGRRSGVLTLLRDLPHLRRAVVGSLLLGDAIGAVVSLSATVLTHELWTARGLPAASATSTLLAMVLVIQLVAAPAAWLAGLAARRFGALPVLLACTAGWVLVVAGAFVGLHDTTDVWPLALGVALVLGGSQTLAKSLVARCTPAGSSGAVFGLTQLAERGTGWLGPTVFAVVVATTGSYRGALASLAVLFVAAAVVLAGVRPTVGADSATGYDASEQYEARRAAVPPAVVPGRGGRTVFAALVRLLSLVCAPVARLRVHGAPLPEDGVLVLANHRSVADGPLLAVVGHRAGRQLRMLGTAGVFTVPAVGPLLHAAGMVPVLRRPGGGGAAADGATRSLLAGEAVALFGEGRITAEADGLPGPLRDGAARLALSAGVPVVCVGLAGADQVTRTGSWRPARGRVIAVVSEPLDLLDLLGLAEPVADPDPALVAEATAVLALELHAQVRRALDLGDLAARR